MQTFSPFHGWRYDPSKVSLSQVLAPPYDVLTKSTRDHLATMSPYNEAVVDAPETNSDDPSSGARNSARTFAQWIQNGIVAPDDQESFYPYAMTTANGHTLRGVIGALGISDHIHPHEATAEHVVVERFELLRATRVNLSPVWGIVPAGTIPALIDEETPVIDVVDQQGVRHRLWCRADEGFGKDLIERTVHSDVVIADGHHRYEAARRLAGSTPSAHSNVHRILALLSESGSFPQMIPSVQRLVVGMAASTFVNSLDGRWKILESGHGDAPSSVENDRALVFDRSRWYLLAIPGLEPPHHILEECAVALDRLDQIDVALLPQRSSVFEGLLDPGERFGIFVPPIAMHVIIQRANLGLRLPIKSTYFSPKPLSGMVFRRLAT